MTQDLSKLDPKLKEAYDRVMGGNVTINSTPPPAGTAPAQPQPTTPQPVTAENQNPSPTMVHTASTPTSNLHSATVTHATVHTSGTEKKKSKGISPIIILLGILLFLIVYAVVWIKFFNLNVPFINP